MKTNPSPLKIRVASPCQADWDKMEGDERARFCSQCNKHVHDLSAMTGAQAADLIRQHQGNLCLRFYQDEHGTVLHLPETARRTTTFWFRARLRFHAMLSITLLTLANIGILSKAQGQVISDRVPGWRSVPNQNCELPISWEQIRATTGMMPQPVPPRHPLFSVGGTMGKMPARPKYPHDSITGTPAGPKSHEYGKQLNPNR